MPCSKKILQLFCFLSVVLLDGTAISIGQEFSEEFSIWPLDLKIGGTVIGCAGPNVQPSVVQAFDDALGENSKVVALWSDNGFEGEGFEKFLGDDDTRLFVNLANPEFPGEKLAKALEAAKGVLIFSSKPVAGNAEKVLDKSRAQLHDLIERKGVVCAIGPVISNLGAFRHETMGSMSLITKDLGLIPDSVVFNAYNDSTNRTSMYGALASRPHSVGIGVQQNTAIVLRGRKCYVLGDGKVTFSVTANERQPYRIKHLADTSGKRVSPYDRVVDLTAWRRDAIERQLPAFPAKNPPAPIVEKGTLFIVGGGGLPKGMMSEMVELAGGKNAHMVYVPCSERDTVPDKHWLVSEWKKMGVASATVFHTKDRSKANSDKEFLEAMKKATGVWFGGGRQWNFADSYYGTEAHRLMKKVLAKDGVIGGSSAGASIQGGYLARANPVANFDIMAPGYERGLGFLPGVAIDQHFSQRGRQKDMTQLANRYPQLLGIGIDETTAIRVRGSTAEVIGKGKVFFYDRRKSVIPGEDDYTALSAGQSFDLVGREIIEDSNSEN